MRTAMILQYDAESDMLYIQLSSGTSVESQEVAPGIVLDFDKKHRVIGVEIEDAAKAVDMSRLELKALPLGDLIVSERTTETARKA